MADVPTDPARGLGPSGHTTFPNTLGDGRSTTPAPKAPNPNLNDYAVLLFGGGDQWDITQLVTNLTWTESFSSPAVETSITLAAPKLRSTVLTADATHLASAFDTVARRGPAINLNNLIKLGMGIRVFASRPDPSGVVIPLHRLSTGSYDLAGEIFRGYIFTKSRSGSTSQDSMEITAYDQMIYLAKNDYDTIFKNQTGTQIIRSLCGRAGLRMAPIGSDFANTHARIGRLVSYGNNLYDCCYLAIQKTKSLTGKYYRLRSEAGLVTLRQRRTPTQVWYLADTSNITDSSFSSSIEELVTGVQPKTPGKLGRTAYGSSVINADLERLYGRMRKVKDLSNLKASEVPKAVKTYMAENAKPKDEANVTIPCVNTIRAGDMVKIRDTDTGLIGLWYISQVTHTVASSQATSALQLVKTATEAQVQPVTEADLNGQSSANRAVSYDKIKGADGKYQRFRVSAGIYTPKGKFAGETLVGDEALVKLDASAAKALGGAGAHVRVQYGRFSILCVVQTRGSYKPYQVMVSASAAEHLGIHNGNAVFIYPMKRHTTGSSSATSSGSGSSRYDALIKANAKKYHVSASLIKGVMEQESSFNPNSRSSAGALGLMQVMPGTAAGMGWKSSEGSLTSPSISIKYGTIYLRDQLATFHTIRLALAAYNGGPGVARRAESSWPTETRNYVRIVTANYQKYFQGGFDG